MRYRGHTGHDHLAGCLYTHHSVTNSGDSVIYLKRCTFTGDSPIAFLPTTSIGSAPLPSGESCTVTAECAPSNRGPGTVAASDWYCDAVAYAYKNDLMGGISPSPLRAGYCHYPEYDRHHSLAPGELAHGLRRSLPRLGTCSGRIVCYR